MSPQDNKQDTGQFNAWLSNLSKPAGGPAPMPHAPAGAPQAAKPKPQGGGVLGDVDGEIDDIFGRIVSEEAPQPFGASAKPAAPTMPVPPQVQQPAPVPPRPQPAPHAPPMPPRPQPATPAFQAPPEAPAMPMLDPRMIEAQIQGAVAEATARLQQEIQELKAQHQAQLQQQAAALQAQLQPQHQAEVQTAVNQVKMELSAQVKDLQAKFQEQRQKWEKILNDLRSRNDDLLKQNQQLEQEISSLRERHSALIHEFADSKNRSPAPPEPVAQEIPESIEMPQPAVALEPEPMPEPAPEPAKDPSELQIPGMPEPQIVVSAPVRTAPEVTLDIPAQKPAVGGGTDDLLAELEALEQEMKKMEN
jgi:hypothetical protein